MRDFPDLEARLPHGLPDAEGDQAVIRQVLAPLVENARRYARAAVRLEVSADRRRVRIAVRDDGPGVDPELGEAIFEPGARGADAEAMGAGLGLPLARRLARAYGGDVVLGPGPGGHFVLELVAVSRVAEPTQGDSEPTRGDPPLARGAPAGIPLQSG